MYAGQVWGLGEELQLDLHDLLDLVLERRVRGEDADDRRQQLSRRPPEYRLGQAFLGAEVVVQERRVHAGFLRDLEGPRAGRAGAHEHRVSRRPGSAVRSLPSNGVA
jgi:hypothetical protein